MKSLFKVTLLAATMAVALNAPLTFAASFRLDGVIPGWTEGLKNIKKGGKIKLVIPPDLAYGKTGVPGIPANSTLVFDVELLDIKPAPKADAQPEAAGDAKAADAKADAKK